MKNNLMIGMWRCIIGVPPFLWEKKIAAGKKKIGASLGFMTAEHRRVHHYAVRELPFYGKPLPALVIARNLGMPAEKVHSILDDLEKHLTFVFMNKDREVVWAYPVTTEKTPHHVRFDTGEQLYAA